MKPVSFFIIVFFIYANVSLAQNKKNNLEDDLYIKAGVELSKFSNNEIKFGDAIGNVIGSVLYDYSKHFQLEAMYKSGYDIPQYSYSYHDTRISQNDPGVENIEHTSDIIHSNSLVLKTNYFINAKKNYNPIYFTGGVVFDIQDKEVVKEVNRNTYQSATNYEHEFYSETISDYNRFLAGGTVGAGLFLAFGKLNVQMEFNLVAKIAPFVDRGYKEYTYNFSLSPVYRF